MSQNYQAVYDAVRSMFSFCNPDQVLRDCIHMDASYAIEQVKQDFQTVAWEQARPAVIFKPTLELKGGKWIAHYGDCEGVGDSPALAMTDFDVNWNKRDA